MTERDDATTEPAGDAPAAVLLGISSMIRIERALWVAARLALADHLHQLAGARAHLDGAGSAPRPDSPGRPHPGDRVVSVDDLAAAADADADSVYRVLRVLASAGIFSEVTPRGFVATPLSNPLRSDAADSVREAILQQGGEHEWRVWGEILHTVRTGEPAFERVWGESPWRYYAATRGRMTQVSRADSAALAGHPLFSGARHIIDVAGGEGDFLAAVLAANPGACGTLIDLPAIVETAGALLDRAGVADRCDVVPGDMFESVPSGGDLYLLKRALHDWNDERARALLRSIHRAMDGRGCLVILTAILPAGDAPSSAKLGDLALMVMLGGRHRTEAELTELLREAGFSVLEVVELPSPLSGVVAAPL